jgi:hypothetical protein
MTHSRKHEMRACTCTHLLHKSNSSSQNTAKCSLHEGTPILILCELQSLPPIFLLLSLLQPFLYFTCIIVIFTCLSHKLKSSRASGTLCLLFPHGSHPMPHWWQSSEAGCQSGSNRFDGDALPRNTCSILAPSPTPKCRLSCSIPLKKEPQCLWAILCKPEWPFRDSTKTP